ncbi:hypothetical protein [Hanamia caeni]|jgi:hypothetical protein|uniref:hypothetical protein n=1 Tax=Hanamia caeni TaxID=2294116 RepID=UPI001314212F|nr:hypothetical protein [Hanamia caeni]
MIEDYLKRLNPRSPDLVYNAQYHIWLKGEYLGIAIWTQDGEGRGLMPTKTGLFP